MAYIHTIIEWCVGYIHTIGINDIIDIAILTFFIYNILIWARNSNVGQVIKGIAVVLLLLWSTSVFNLHVMNYILNNVLELGFLAIVIVFQPEIRHALEQIGAKGFGQLFSTNVNNNEIEKAIDELVEAYTSMSKDKVGALSVFERSSILDDCIKSGTALECSVTSELLKNLFWNKAPLHDGAIIIRNGKIIGAGCVLPLTADTTLSRDLGTRHRAGIGITEHTDAIAVICSEETGGISIAISGKLERNISPNMLAILLKGELLPKNTDKSQERRLLRNAK